MDYGKWLNKENGYRDTKLYDEYWLGSLNLWPTAIYNFRLDELHPLGYVSPQGLIYRPCVSFDSDRGSIPSFVSILSSRDTFLVSYYMHDCGCRFGGLWVSKDGGLSWQWVELSRAEMDTLLWFMVMAEGGTRLQAGAIYRGVRIGAFLGIGGSRDGSYRHKPESMMLTRRYA